RKRDLVRRLEEGGTERAVLQTTIHWRAAEVRAGRKVDQRHPVAHPGIGVRRRDGAGLAEALPGLNRYRGGMIAAAVRHPIHLAELRFSPRRYHLSARPVDPSIKQATTLPARGVPRRSEVGVGEVDLPDGSRVDKVDGGDNIPG